jgi:hypothetical protein
MTGVVFAIYFSNSQSKTGILRPVVLSVIPTGRANARFDDRLRIVRNARSSP